MSKLSIEQKNVGDLFTDKKNDFLIPDYQRPYAWGEKECQTLWDDIFTFAFPENDCDKFDSNNDEYFLGPIVTFNLLQYYMHLLRFKRCRGMDLLKIHWMNLATWPKIT